VKLVVAIVQGEDAGHTVQALNAAGISVTRLASSGGFSPAGQRDAAGGHRGGSRERGAGAGQGQLPRTQPVPDADDADGGAGEVLMTFPVEVQVGGATIFVLNAEQFEKL